MARAVSSARRGGSHLTYGSRLDQPWIPNPCRPPGAFRAEGRAMTATEALRSAHGGKARDSLAARR